MLIVPSYVSLLRLVRPFVGFLLDDAHSPPPFMFLSFVNTLAIGALVLFPLHRGFRL